jgi:hypothetical protein
MPAVFGSSSQDHQWQSWNGKNWLLRVGFLETKIKNKIKMILKGLRMSIGKEEVMKVW